MTFNKTSTGYNDNTSLTGLGLQHVVEGATLFNRMEIEIWKDITNYEHYYQVSSLGNVRRINSITSHNHKRKEIILKKCGQPYKAVQLCKNNISIKFLIHRLVAQAFIPNPENKPQVNHKNGIKWDNRVENLEWVTPSENGLHAYRVLNKKPSKAMLGKFGILHGGSKLCAQYDMKGNLVKIYHGCNEASRETGICISAIASCASGTFFLKRGKYKQVLSAGGFTWKYINNE